MTQRGKLILSWVLVALWAALIFFMSAHAGSDFSGTGPLAAVKGWLVSLAAPAFGEDFNCVYQPTVVSLSCVPVYTILFLS